MATTSDLDFLAGRDIAVAMLKALKSASGDGALEAKYRDGADQDNLVLKFVERVIARPETAEGFSAILTDGLYRGGSFAGIDVYEQLSLSEMRGSKHDARLQSLLRGLEQGDPHVPRDDTDGPDA